MVASRPAPTLDDMTRRAPSTRLPALGTAVLLLGAWGLSACGGPAADGPVDPIVMTDPDGVLHGPDEGAAPVPPADPAPAGRDVVTEAPPAEQETRRDTEPAAPPPPAEPDDDPEPPPPPPPPPADVDDDEEEDASDDAPDGDGDGDGDGDSADEGDDD